MSRVTIQEETRHYTDGSIEVTILTAYGEPIVSLRVSDRSGFNDKFAEHRVSFCQRENLHNRDMFGSEFFVSVPLSTGEQLEVKKNAVIQRSEK